MVRIVIDIPEWAFGGNLYVISRKELLAYSHFERKKKGVYVTEKYTPLKIKTNRCNGCGYCCENLGSPFSKKQHEAIQKQFQENTFQEFGRCPLLGDKGCILGKEIPLGCVISDCSRFEPCTESFKEIGVESSG